MADYNAIVNVKRSLIDIAAEKFHIRTFADLGGLWGVDGGYSFYAASKMQSGTLVDTIAPSPEILSKLISTENLRIFRGDFRHPTICDHIGPIDCVFLFDVLLHQSNPDWKEVVRIYAHQCHCFLVSQPQWTGDGRCVNLFSLGEQDYFRHTATPYDPGLFSRGDNGHGVWQWGITNDDLQECMESHGFLLVYYQDSGQWFDKPLFSHRSFIYVNRSI